MDYSLAALKLLCSQLKDVREVASQNSFTLFQRAWLQVSLSPFLFPKTPPFSPLHYASWRSRLLLRWRWCPSVSRRRNWSHRTLPIRRLPPPPLEVGMYVMVVGGYVIRTGEPPMIKIHKIVDLSSSPYLEAMRHLEVIEAYKLFYQPLVEEFT